MSGGKEWEWRREVSEGGNGGRREWSREVGGRRKGKGSVSDETQLG